MAREEASDRDMIYEKRNVPESHINHRKATHSVSMQATIAFAEQQQKK